MVSRCEGGIVRAGAPRRIDDGSDRCSEEYEVDFTVEGAPGDGMLLDMFQSHMPFNWRVEERGEMVRHEFTLRLRPAGVGPGPGALEGLPGVFSHEPIVIEACPEGDAARQVLACTTTGCGIYDGLREVPALAPSDLGLAITVPVEFRRTGIRIREGETLEIPVTFHIFRPYAGAATLRPYVNIPTRVRDFVDLQFAPAVIRVPTSARGTRTRILSVMVKRFDHEGYRDQHPGASGWNSRTVQVVWNPAGFGGGCFTRPYFAVKLLLADP